MCGRQIGRTAASVLLLCLENLRRAEGWSGAGISPFWNRTYDFDSRNDQSMVGTMRGLRDRRWEMRGALSLGSQGNLHLKAQDPLCHAALSAHSSISRLIPSRPPPIYQLIRNPINLPNFAATTSNVSSAPKCQLTSCPATGI